MSHHRAWSCSLLFLCFHLALTSAASGEHYENWIEIRTPHFTVYSNAGEREGREAAAHFEEVREMFHQLYPQLRVDPGKPTVVFALKNEDSLKLLIPSYGTNKKAMHIGGFYRNSADKNFAVIRMDTRGSGALGYTTLYHEYTHAIFRLNFRGLPVWLEEGLAEMYGNSQIGDKQATVGMANGDELRLLRQSTLLPIATLVTIDRTSPLYNTADHSGIFYAESWALVHYLSFSEEMRNQNLINKFLQTLHETDDPIAAAQQTFGDLGRLSKNLQSYAVQNMFYSQRLQLQGKLSDVDYKVRTLSPAEGLLAQADFLLRNGHLPEGLELLHKIDGLDPKTPGFHMEMGCYHYLKADYANAAKEFELALAANPSDVSAHYFSAYTLYRKSGYNKETTPLIREHLEKILSVSPEFVAAHAFLSIAYSQEPNPDNSKALAAAKRASQLEPGNLAFFIDIGRALLADGRIADARTIAASAQKAATSPGDRSMATNFSKQVDAKVNRASAAPASAAAADESAAATDASGTSSPGTTSRAASALHAEGQISELICGHPPEVMLTLSSSGNESLLLHIVDTAKISMQDKGASSNSAMLPCAKWKDRHAKVEYESSSGGIAKGEIRSIVFD